VSNVGIFFTSYAVFTFIGRLVAGRLSDRSGQRKIVLPFMLLEPIAAFLLSFLHDLSLLILIGGCYGLGFGALMPALSAYVVDETSRKDRASALSFFTAFMDLGIGAGAVILGVIGELWGYEAMFYLAGAITVLGLLLFAASTRPGSPQRTTDEPEGRP
jgi:MFS family permease